MRERGGERERGKGRKEERNCGTEGRRVQGIEKERKKRWNVTKQKTFLQQDKIKRAKLSDPVVYYNIKC